MPTTSELPVRDEAAVNARGRAVVEAHEDKDAAREGILDVTRAPYGADPTGRRDSTGAIQRALADARDARLIAYLPAGTYRVSDTITGVQGTVTRLHHPEDMPGGDPVVDYLSYYYPCVLRGPATGPRAKIVLADRSPGFDDPQNPKPVIHFWARQESGDSPDPSQPQPSISFNQMIIDVDFDLGQGNPGAVAIFHQAAQGSVTESVHIEAHGAFAGLLRGPGSGGGVHRLRVEGGLYGLYLAGGRYKGTQPSPVFSHVVLRDQEKASVYYGGRGPLTLVGFHIDGKGIVGESEPLLRWDGQMNLIDGVIRLRGEGAAVSSRHSVYMRNVWVSGAKTVCAVEEAPALPGDERGTVHVREYAAGAMAGYPAWWPAPKVRDGIWVDGVEQGETLVHLGEKGAAAEPDAGTIEALLERHAWQGDSPWWRGEDVVNAARPPYGARGDGVADDWAAIQRALDEHKSVFLPKGEYRISRPLRLGPENRLFGLSNLLAVIVPDETSPYFSDPTNPRALVETVDDPEARTMLAFVELQVPATSRSVMALDWRAGRNSTVRNVHVARTLEAPAGAPLVEQPKVRIRGSGGGRWYNLVCWRWWGQGPGYRHVLIEGTHEPLAIYMLNVEHAKSEVQVEVRSARHVSVFGMKGEGNPPVLWFRNCSAFAVYGYSGNGCPYPGDALFRIDDSDDFTLTCIAPILRRGGTVSKFAGPAFDPDTWYLVVDRSSGERESVHVTGDKQFVLYRRGSRRRNDQH